MSSITTALDDATAIRKKQLADFNAGKKGLLDSVSAEANGRKVKKLRTKCGRSWKVGDWLCPKCGNMNYGDRTFCHWRTCAHPKPSAEADPGGCDGSAASACPGPHLDSWEALADEEADEAGHWVKLGKKPNRWGAARWRWRPGEAPGPRRPAPADRRGLRDAARVARAAASRR